MTEYNFQGDADKDKQSSNSNPFEDKPKEESKMLSSDAEEAKIEPVSSEPAKVESTDPKVDLASTSAPAEPEPEEDLMQKAMSEKLKPEPKDEMPGLEMKTNEESKEEKAKGDPDNKPKKKMSPYTIAIGVFLALIVIGTVVGALMYSRGDQYKGSIGDAIACESPIGSFKTLTNRTCYCPSGYNQSLVTDLSECATFPENSCDLALETYIDMSERPYDYNLDESGVQFVDNVIEGYEAKCSGECPLGQYLQERECIEIGDVCLLNQEEISFFYTNSEELSLSQETLNQLRIDSTLCDDNPCLSDQLYDGNSCMDFTCDLRSTMIDDEFALNTVESQAAYDEWYAGDGRCTEGQDLPCPVGTFDYDNMSCIPLNEDLCTYSLETLKSMKDNENNEFRFAQATYDELLIDITNYIDNYDVNCPLSDEIKVSDTVDSSGSGTSSGSLSSGGTTDEGECPRGIPNDEGQCACPENYLYVDEAEGLDICVSFSCDLRYKYTTSEFEKLKNSEHTISDFDAWCDDNPECGSTDCKEVVFGADSNVNDSGEVAPASEEAVVELDTIGSVTVDELVVAIDNSDNATSVSVSEGELLYGALVSGNEAYYTQKAIEVFGTDKSDFYTVPFDIYNKTNDFCDNFNTFIESDHDVEDSITILKIFGDVEYTDVIESCENDVIYEIAKDILSKDSSYTINDLKDIVNNPIEDLRGFLKEEVLKFTNDQPISLNFLIGTAYAQSGGLFDESLENAFDDFHDAPDSEPETTPPAVEPEPEPIVPAIEPEPEVVTESNEDTLEVILSDTEMHEAATAAPGTPEVGPSMLIYLIGSSIAALGGRKLFVKRK